MVEKNGWTQPLEGWIYSTPKGVLGFESALWASNSGKQKGLEVLVWTVHSGSEYTYGCGSKTRYQNGTLVSGNMDQNLRNPSWLILSHTHM